MATHPRALTVADENPLLHNSYGSLISTLGQHAEAIEHFRRALQLKPDLTNAMINLAGSLAATEHFAEAAHRLEQAAETRKGNEPARATRLRQRAERYHAQSQ